MPKDLTVTALAMWGLFALGVIVGTCYCYTGCCKSYSWVSCLYIAVELTKFKLNLSL